MSNVEFVYREVTSKRTVSGDEFARGVIDFDFSMGAPTCWIPSKSYFRIEMSVAGSRGNLNPGEFAPSAKDLVTLADNAPANLFNNAYFKAGGQAVSSIVQYLPQASQLKSRMFGSKGYLSTVGDDAYMHEADFTQRCIKHSDLDDPAIGDRNQEIYKSATGLTYATSTCRLEADSAIVGENTLFATAGDTLVKKGDILVLTGVHFTVISVTDNLNLVVDQGTSPVTIANNTDYYFIRKNLVHTHENKHKVFSMFQPPLGIFDKSDPMGAGDYRITLNAAADYKKAGVESKNPNANATVAVGNNSYDLYIHEIRFYVATAKMSIPQGLKEYSFYEYDIQSKAISGAGGVSGTHEFTCPSSTIALALFVQDNASGSTVLVPPSMFKARDTTHLNLRSLQISYANVTKPSTSWQSSNRQLEQRYHDTLVETNNITQSGGTETYADYLKRGPYYMYSFDRDSSDKSTQVQVIYDYTSLNNCNLFLCALYRTRVDIVHQDGQVQSVQKYSV